MSKTRVDSESSGPWVGFSGYNDGVLYRRAVSLTGEDECSTDIDVPDERSEPLSALETEEKLLLLRWLLEEAERKGIVVNYRSQKFIEWARSMINTHCYFLEGESIRLSS
ncbi:MAG: hypothetical protein A2675_02930 [Candidatus Yonathbacteria bacterium RIFCSPHIGHO2_01_FULL_51_10]|uniref:Uncharacterized protein n=1 Tax=Candidatus Yonathbacteria bacterium RIFCSPHIGHO2_01_FULL_51_10 TaxID=1802723 RepID=A0A1G2SAL9_9BACT|nr:MAG: hypothetical protein A2675_02930 [Candidatus Yonathbacteria bacterium RIFCSPHIGHO2_01_FULL_51_10]